MPSTWGNRPLRVVQTLFVWWGLGTQSVSEEAHVVKVAFVTYELRELRPPELTGHPSNARQIIDRTLGRTTHRPQRTGFSLFAPHLFWPPIEHWEIDAVP